MQDNPRSYEKLQEIKAFLNKELPRITKAHQQEIISGGQRHADFMAGQKDALTRINAIIYRGVGDE